MAKRLRRFVQSLLEQTTTGQQSTCEMYSTFEMVCPLCKLTIPPGTYHKCQQRGSTAGSTRTSGSRRAR